ncbi:MAG TPA: right-handed parallel beta-helix repeat-containing protein [Thermoanaerobaculia bacterium]
MEKPFPALLRLVGATVLFCLAATSSATDFYVSPSASANGNGSFNNPWRLQDALDQPSSVHPGDTIWLRGGTYSGTFVSYLNGTSASPIIVRQYAGEQATLDGGSSTTANISVRGGYTWFWGFEIKNSDTHRQSTQSGSDPTDIHRGDGIQIWQTGTEPGLKFINLVIHDTRQGVSFWEEATDAEINGCIIYYNGWNGTERGHGHGIYTQNNTGTKHIVNNIIFENFDHGIQGYGSSSAHLKNYDVQGNTFSRSGIIAIPDGGRNLLIGGDTPAQNLTITSNYLYYKNAESPDSAFQLGYGAPCSGTTVTGNYVSNNTDFEGCNPTSMTGNTFYGSTTGFSQSSYPSNTYTTTRPSGVKVFVRASPYEAGRANVTVFNWPNQSSVSVDLSSVLGVGTAFEIRNAHDFFGAPVLTGTYAGGSVSLPMTGLSVASPIGWSAPSPTGPEFNVFVVVPVLGAPAPTATRTPTPGGPTPTHTPTPGGPTATPTRTPTPGGGGALPAPWQQQDIGSPGLSGSATYSGGAFTINASGSDIETNSDKFHYVYESLSGDGTIIARVSSIEYTNAWAKGGVMIRESLNTDSRQAMMVLTPGNGVAFQRRLSTGGMTVNTSGVWASAPYWVKLVRSGSTFTGYASSDGSSWTQVGSDSISMATSVFVGLALTAHDNSQLCTAVIDNVTAPTGGGGGGSFLERFGAEDGALASPMAVYSDSGAFGGQYVRTLSANAGTDAFTFTAPSDGTYYVWGRVRAVDEVHDSFYVKMDSGSEDVYDVVTSWGTSWQWTRLNGRNGTSTPRTLNPRTFSLSEGSHTLTFRGREADTWLDRVIVTNDGSFVPTEAP